MISISAYDEALPTWPGVWPLPGLQVELLGGVQRRFLRNVVGQILAEPIMAPVHARELRIARLTGYALRQSDLPNAGYCRLRMAGSATPAAPFLDSLEERECVQVYAGALLPREADCFFAVDSVEQTPGGIVLHMPLGDHRRHWAVTQLVAHDPEGIVFRAGHAVTVTDLGIMAALGCYEVTIRRPVRVGTLFLGEERERASDGMSYDESHRFNLYGALARLDVEILDIGSVGRLAREDLNNVLFDCDLLIIVGGISGSIVGDTVPALPDPYWTIATRRLNMAYGRVQNTICLALPQAPLTVMLAFQEVIRPLVARLRGEAGSAPLTYITDNGPPLRAIRNH
jgi:molybdopterin molybdotransferase